MIPMPKKNIPPQCPFFLFGGRKSVGCEGITDDCFIRLVFKSEEKKTTHENIFCNKMYKNCEIYRMLMREKYEEDDL